MCSCDDLLEELDVFRWKTPQSRESTQVETEDAGHQVKQAKKEKWVENELMTRYLCNKLRQEHTREWMMSGGDQNGQKV